MHFGGHDLTADNRDGRREHLAFSSGDSEPPHALCQGLRDSGLATLAPPKTYGHSQIIRRHGTLLGPMDGAHAVVGL
jgi:hypothetical protein